MHIKYKFGYKIKKENIYGQKEKKIIQVWRGVDLLFF